MRGLTVGMVWFDGAAEAYLTPRLARALGKTMMQIRKIARRSIRPHRRKRLGELTPYEREFYAPQGRDKRGRFAKREYDKKRLPMQPGAPGEAPRYSPNARYGFNYRDSVLAVYDPQTASGVCGPVIDAGSGSQRRMIVKTLEDGGMQPISYGPQVGRMTYIKSRPLMKLALAAARPYIAANFQDLDTLPVVDGSFFH